MTEVKACKQADCPVRKSGQCLEGIDLETDTCTHFYWDTSDAQNDDHGGSDDDSDEQSAIPSLNLNRTTLFSGNELTLQEVNIVTHKYNCELVVILGDQECGKTTLLATIFDLFQVGEFDEYLFAGSLTQKGFEVRSHLARVVSGQHQADTERTKALEFRILHLAVKSNNYAKIKHLLLSDVSGETIRQARSSATIMRTQLEIVKKADHLFYIIDGERLLIEHRTTTMLNTDLFFQSALDNGVFNRRTIINVLISKWDKISNIDNFNLEEVVCKKINSRFGERVAQIKYSVIASRPDENSEKFDLGFGVNDFLDIFFVPTENAEVISEDAVVSERLIDKFKMKSDE